MPSMCLCVCRARALLNLEVGRSRPRKLAVVAGWSGRRKAGRSVSLFSRCRQQEQGAGEQRVAGFDVEFNDLAPGLAVSRLESMGSSTRYTVAGVALREDPTVD